MTALSVPRSAALAVLNREDEPKPPPQLGSVGPDSTSRTLASPQAASLNRITFDTAIEMNRRLTPKAAVDKRLAPRYSIAELNAMDIDAIRERFDRLPQFDYDTRPGIIRFLDVVDLPRNALFNLVTSVAAPEIRREALERGDLATFGLQRVTGADILRGMGLNNNVVAGVGGFAIDVVADPLSWLFAPAKVVSLVGKGGTRLVMGATAANRMSRAFKQVARGGIEAVEDQTLKRVFATTTLARKINATAPDELASALRKSLMGDEATGVRRAAASVFGPSGKGGDLVEKAFSVVDEAAGPTVRTVDELDQIDQIAAIKDFVREATINRGVQLGGDGAGTVVAHVPFTDRSLTVKAFTPAGRQAVLQRAASAAMYGNSSKATVLATTANTLSRFDTLTKRMNDLSDEESVLTHQDRLARAADAAMYAKPSETTIKLASLKPDSVVSFPGSASVGTQPTINDQLRVIEESDEMPGIDRLKAIAYRHSRNRELTKDKIGRIVGLNSASMKAGDSFKIGPDAVTVTDVSEDGVTLSVGGGKKMIVDTEIETDPRIITVARGEVVPANKGSFSALSGRVVVNEPLEAVKTEMDAINKGLKGGWQKVSPEAREAAMDSVNRLDEMDDDELDAALDMFDAIEADDAVAANIAKYVGEDALNERGLLGVFDDIANTLRDGNGFETIDDMGDMLAVAQLAGQIRAQKGMAEAAADWRDADRLASRLNMQGVAEVKKLQNAASKLAASRLGLDPATALDDIADDASRMAEFEGMRNSILEKHRGRLAEHVMLSEADLESARKVAEAFDSYIQATQLAADYALTPIHSLMHADAKALANGALSAAGLSPDIYGYLPFQSFTSAARRNEKGFGQAANAFATMIGGPDGLNRVDALGRGIATRFGQKQSAFNDARAASAREVSTSTDSGDQFVRDVLNGSPRFSRGLKRIAKDHGVVADHKLMALLGALATTRKGGGAKHFLFDIDGEPGAAMRAIQEARETGMLQNAGLERDLSVLADELGDLVDARGWESVQSGALTHLQSNEGSAGFPVALGKEAAKRVTELQTNAGPLAAGRAGMAARLKEGFQKPRSTWEIRFKADDGSVKSFLVIDKSMYGPLDDIQLEQWDHGTKIDQDTAAFARKQKETIAEFEKKFGEIDGEDGDAIIRTHGRPLDSYELNERFSSGQFRTITGGPFDGEIFTNNIIDAMARRESQVAARHGQDAFVEAVINAPQAIRVDTNNLAMHLGKTEEVILPNGVRAMTMGDSERLRIGDVTYRLLRTKGDHAVPADLIEKIAGPAYAGKTYQTMYPEPMALNIERFFSQMKPEKLDAVLNAANQFTKVWRAQTLFHPSWVTVNTIGNSMLLFMDHRGIHATTLGRQLKDATRIAMNSNNPEKLRAMEFTIGGQKLTGLDLWELARNNRVTSGNVEDAKDQIMRAMLAYSDAGVQQRSGVINPVRGYKASYNQRMIDATAARRIAEAPTKAEARRMAFTAGLGALSDSTFKPVFNSWFTLNGKVDDSFRLASMMQHMENGSDAISAAEKARRGMLNFGDLTDFETKTVRSVVPFYSWLRASLPNMLSRLGSDPAYFTSINRVRDLVEETTAGDEKLPWHMRPSWIQQQLGLQIGADPENRLAITIGTALPQEQALRVATGLAGLVGSVSPIDTGFGGKDVLETLDYLIGQQSPILKMATELGQQRELFTGRTIGATPEQGDIGVSEYLLGQIRWARELGIGGVGQGPLFDAFGKSPAQGVGRLLVGGRLQSGLQEDRRLSGLRRDLEDKTSPTRKAIYRAERAGDAAASLRARAILLKHYRDHLLSGGDQADVPKWARAQLEAIGQ